MNQYSLLGHVAPGLTNQLENLATESLLYLLRRYDLVHKTFCSMLLPLGFVAPDGLEFDSQLTISDGAIPDLVGTDISGNHLVYVESKFWATLTPNQPVGYLKQLPVGDEGIVLFIAPTERYRTLWKKITKRAEKAGYLLSEPVEQSPDWHSIRISQTGRLAYIGWSYLLNHLQQVLENAGEDQAAHEVWQLRGLCQRLDAEAYHPIEDSELVSGRSKEIQQLRSIVNSLVERLTANNVFDLRGYQATPGPDYYRRYGSIQGQVNCFVEYSERNARRFGRTMIWAGCPSSKGAITQLLGRSKKRNPES